MKTERSVTTKNPQLILSAANKIEGGGGIYQNTSFNQRNNNVTISIHARVRLFPQEESVWWCLDVFFVLLGLGQGEVWTINNKSTTTNPVWRGWKASTFQSNTTFLPPLLKGVVVPFLCLLQCALVKIFTHVKESFRSSFYPCPPFGSVVGSSREINDLSLDPGKRARKYRKFPSL